MEVYPNLRNARAIIRAYDFAEVGDFSVSSRPVYFGNLIEGNHPYSMISLFSRNEMGILLNTFVYDLVKMSSRKIVEEVAKRYGFLSGDSTLIPSFEDSLSKILFLENCETPKFEISSCSFDNPYSLSLFRFHADSVSKLISLLPRTGSQMHSLNLGDFEIHDERVRATMLRTAKLNGR